MIMRLPISRQEWVRQAFVKFVPVSPDEKERYWALFRSTGIPTRDSAFIATAIHFTCHQLDPQSSLTRETVAQDVATREDRARRQLSTYLMRQCKKTERQYCKTALS